jgi:WD repeat-containing protein 81
VFTHFLPLKNLYYDDEAIHLDYDITDLSNLRDILLYSPRAIDQCEKILFIFYQLLKLVKHLNELNLNVGEIRLNDIYLDHKYWVRVKLPIQTILDMYRPDAVAKSLIASSTTAEQDERTTTAAEAAALDELTNDELDEDNESDAEEHDQDRTDLSNAPISAAVIKQSLADTYDSYKHLNYNDLADVTKNWCNNRVSNFDYLLILNCVAGKKLNCPFNHPIFPWISDFQSLSTNLRDLSTSKFRLNKGDAHLDLIYQASAATSTGSYHLTEFLSEITYFVYKARVTEKETLCKHVRRTWVPGEYPISMSRLFLWTPEECIPEFFCDTSIFKSIHDDLPDLRLPDWCNGSADEFVRTHRLLLDSDLVSKKLHNWIDLVFGYRVGLARGI